MSVKWGTLKPRHANIAYIVYTIQDFSPKKPDTGEDINIYIYI